MATPNKTEKILIGFNDEVVELLGAEREAFIAEREIRIQEAAILEAEYKAKQDSRESAIKKLAEIAGLTKEEINAIL